MKVVFLFPLSIEWGLHERKRPPKREVSSERKAEAPTVTREHPRGAGEAAGMTGKSLIRPWHLPMQREEKALA